MVMLGEEQSFTLTANVTSPGYIRTAVKGFLVSRRNGETWIAPLIPQLFYGADGNQLSTWRQPIPQAGSQVILSRQAGGLPKVPREELFWRRVTQKEEPSLAKPAIETRAITPEQWEQFWAMGDVNRDGYINQVDLDIITAAFGNFIGEPDYDERADLNKDDLVDIQDVSVCAFNQGKNIWDHFGIVHSRWDDLTIWWKNLPWWQKTLIITSVGAGAVGSVYVIAKK